MIRLLLLGISALLLAAAAVVTPWNNASVFQDGLALHLQWNAVFPFDPASGLELLRSALQLPPSAKPLLVATASLSVFLLGVTAVRREFHRSSFFSAFCEGIAAATLLLFCFGFDPPLFQLLALAPWMFLFTGLYWQQTVSYPVFLFFFSVFSLLLFDWAGPGAVLVLLLVLFCFLPLQRTERRLSWTLVAAASLLYLSLSFTYEPPNLPSYPNTGRLVPDDGVAGHAYPFFFPAPSLPLLSREDLVGILSIPAVLLLFFAAFWFAESVFRKEQRGIVGLSAVIFLALMLLIDLLLPAWISLQAPLQAYRRLVPGQFFLPTAPLVIALTIVVGALSVPRHTVSRILLFSIPVLMAVWHLLPLDSSRPIGFMIQPETMLQHRKALLLPSDLRVKAFSPSWWTVRTNGVRRSLLEEIPSRFRSPRGLDFTVWSFTENEEQLPFKRLYDGNPRTRWTSGTGRQKGGEWLAIRFAAPVPVEALKLESGRFGGDYPRGVRIRSAAECAEGETPSGTVVFEERRWIGPVLRTEEGFPYLGPEQEVLLPFSHMAISQCLFIEQTGSAPLDWSIAELLISGPDFGPIRLRRPS